MLRYFALCCDVFDVVLFETKVVFLWSNSSSHFEGRYTLGGKQSYVPQSQPIHFLSLRAASIRQHRGVFPLYHRIALNYHIIEHNIHRRDAPLEDMLLAQDQYVQAVSLAHKEACEVNGRKYLKDERLRELLKAPHLKRVPRRARGSGNGGEGPGTGGGGGGGSVPMPLDPTVQVIYILSRRV